VEVGGTAVGGGTGVSVLGTAVGTGVGCAQALSTSMPARANTPSKVGIRELFIFLFSLKSLNPHTFWRFLPNHKRIFKDLHCQIVEIPIKNSLRILSL
jgi:hypothetical protein